MEVVIVLVASSREGVASETYTVLFIPIIPSPSPRNVIKYLHHVKLTNKHEPLVPKRVLTVRRNHPGNQFHIGTRPPIRHSRIYQN
ncbi:unnamed protein product [Musa acuminata subsp. malaccensis]|uniref:(wild Malaysian banana) hypothetical protein n=1 Tax=Musa acuminata subsp. malaccensis TaxID=214687 RepID=A0A804IJL2_MUSAM|nr:unnamed protein product [Musa acuminata subsp. malaccensis]